MKKVRLFCLVIFLLTVTNLLALNTSETRKINVATAGNLSSLLPQNEREYVVNLTLTGKLNGTDFNVLRTMATSQKLQSLDLSGANIMSGGASYYTNYGTNYYTKDNEFGYCLFNGCKKLQKIVLPNSLVTIGQCAFWYCSNLKTLVIGSKVTTIMPGVWGGCSQLTDVQIKSNSNFHLDNGILYNKNYTTIIAALLTWNYGDLSIRNGVTEIQYGAFSFCSKMTSVTFPSSVTKIGDTAFEYTGITSVKFTSAITSIGSFAFSGCKSLKELDLTPLKLTSLDYGVFMTSNIEIVYMPKSLKELKQSVFSGTPLKHIFVYTATPATMYDLATSSPTFKNVDVEKCTVHVPQGRVNIYKAAAGWKDFLYITDSQEIESETEEAYAVYTSDGTLTFYYDKQKSSRSGTKYALNTGTNDPGWYTDHSEEIKKVVFHSSFSGARPTTTYNWFAVDLGKTSKLSEITGMQYLNTSFVTIMKDMFYHCSSLTSINLSNFNTGNVITMGGMFDGCSSLTSLDVSNFNTEKVNSMESMFRSCSSLTTLDVNNFNTEKVTDMDLMFGYCSSLTSLNISNINTENVWYMHNMFAGCSSLKILDISSFNTKNVKRIQEMFKNCTSLTTIYAGANWNIDNVSDYDYGMFLNCTSLVGGAGTKYDANHVDKAYAHIDGGVSNPGYLTDKNNSGSGNGDDLQTFIDANAGATGVVTVDLSKFKDVVREATLDVSTGASYRFINGKLDRAVTLNAPVMSISNNSQVQVADGALITGIEHITDDTFTETIRMAGGYMIVDGGTIEGSVGGRKYTNGVTVLGNAEYDPAVRLTSNSDHFILKDGVVYGAIVCDATNADVQLLAGRLRGMGLRVADEGNTQNIARRAAPMGSREPHINTRSDVYISSTTSKDYTWGYYWFDGEPEQNAFSITLYPSSKLCLKKHYDAGFCFRIYDKQEGDVVAIGDGYTLTDADLQLMSVYDNTVYYTVGSPYIDNREPYLELKDNKVYLRYKKDEVCDADDIQRFIENLGNSGSADMTLCDEPTIDGDVDVDDIQIFIDGTDQDPQPVIGFYGGSINIKQNAGMSFKSVTFASKDVATISQRASGSDGGIRNSGTLTFENCIFRPGNYTIENSGDAYINEAVEGCHIVHKNGGRIHINNSISNDLYITIPAKEDVELNTPFITGISDASHILLTVPTGYDWRYDAETGGIIVYASTGVSAISGEQPRVVDDYDMTGRKADIKTKGMHIQRMNDGTTKKIVITK